MDHVVVPGRLRRLTEELAELGVAFDDLGDPASPLVEELDYALRPPVHERRVPSYGAIVEPVVDVDAWYSSTQLALTRRAVDELSRKATRRFADGLSSWFVRGPHSDADELAVFDRPAGSERDLVIIAEAAKASIVQRHPAGDVRVVGGFGVLRWDGVVWYHEPPVTAWIESVSAVEADGDRRVLKKLLAFAVHDLGARRVGAILVYRPTVEPPPEFELRLPVPPPLRIDDPADLAPLRHVLGQVDGAAVFDRSGTLQQLGVRLVPSAAAESDVAGYRGMRHTAGRRYSFDDPTATVVVVSDDGPVTVLRGGELLGTTTAGANA
jgi:hypothetical protein